MDTGLSYTPRSESHTEKWFFWTVNHAALLNNCVSFCWLRHEACDTMTHTFCCEIWTDWIGHMLHSLLLHPSYRKGQNNCNVKLSLFVYVSSFLFLYSVWYIMYVHLCVICFLFCWVWSILKSNGLFLLLLTHSMFTAYSMISDHICTVDSREPPHISARLLSMISRV